MAFVSLGTAPKLIINPNDEFAWMRWVAALAWGGDHRKQNQALATFGSESIAALRETRAEQSWVNVLHTLARRVGVHPDEMALMRGTRRFYSSYFAEPVKRLKAVFKNVF